MFCILLDHCIFQSVPGITNDVTCSGQHTDSINLLSPSSWLACRQCSYAPSSLKDATVTIAIYSKDQKDCSIPLIRALKSLTYLLMGDLEKERVTSRCSCYWRVGLKHVAGLNFAWQRCKHTDTSQKITVTKNKAFIWRLIQNSANGRELFLRVFFFFQEFLVLWFFWYFCFFECQKKCINVR